MEHGDSFYHYGQDANSSSGSFPIANTGAPASPINNAPAPQLAAVGDKNIMPITNVTKIMRQALPLKTKISDDAKEMVQQCASKYIAYITKKASERCQREYRKIMKAEDLLWAMENLGFADYVNPLTLYLQRYRLIEGNSTRGEPISPGFMQGIDNNWSGSGLGFGPGIGLGLGPVQQAVDIPQPTLPAVEIPQPTLPAVGLGPIGPDSFIDPGPNVEMPGQVDLDAFCDGFGPAADFDFECLLGEGEDDDNKTN